MGRPPFARASAALLVALASCPAVGRAQSGSDLQIAQALYDDAAKDLAARNYAAACPKLEEAARLTPEGVGVRLTLGACYEGLGKLASAYAAYELAEAVATRARKADRQKAAHEHVVALKPRLATLRIVVSDEVRSLPGLEIRRGATIVGQAQWGLVLPADKGKHVATVTTGDGRTWEAVAEIVADGSSVDLRVDLPSKTPDPVTPGAPAAPMSEPAPTSPIDADSSRPRRIAGIVLGSAGLAAILAGAGLGITAVVKKSQSNADGHCNATNHCDSQGTDLRWGSLAAGNWSTAMFIGGGVALVGGVVLFATARASAAPPSSGRLMLHPAGFSFAGEW